MYEQRAEVRNLRIGLAVFAALTLVVTGVIGSVASALRWDGLLTPGPSWDDRFTITSYDVTGTLRDDGRLRVTEDIEVEWHEPRRGLIRDIDRSAPAGEVSVETIDVISDTQDDVWFEVRADEVAGHDSVHLGEEHDFRPLGSDHYRITYDLDGLLVEVDGTPTLRWNTFGDQWTTLIELATVTLDLPDGDHDLGCVVGSEGQAFACDGDGPTWSAQDMQPGRGLTVEARFESAVTVDALPEADLGPLEEFSTVARQRLGLIAGLTGAATLPLLGTIGAPVTRQRRRRARERIETTGVAYVPPAGMRPLTAGPLVAGEASAAKDEQLFAAWLLDAQQRDLIEVAPEGKGFRVRFTGRGTADSDPEAAALLALVPDPTGGWVTWDRKTDTKQARRFEQAWQALVAHHRKLAAVPNRVASRLGPWGGLLLVAGLAAAWLLWGVTPLGGAAVGIGVLGAWGASTSTDRTLRTTIAELDPGQLEVWRQVEGLRRFVAEAHAEQISGLADDPNVPIDSPFLELLPWVIAFGHGDQWAERFELQIEAATEPRGYYAPIRAREISRTRSAAKPRSSSSSSGGGSSGVGSGGGGGGGRSR